MKKGIEPIRTAALTAGVLVVLFVVFMYVYSDSIDSRNRTYSAAGTYILQSAAESDDPEKIDINSASMEILLSVPGMSENNAREIVLYRERHRGFADIEELKNLPSFDEDTYLRLEDKLCVNDGTYFVPQNMRVNINTADIRELKSVPGMTASAAESIIDYRERHGSFVSLQELIEIEGIGETTYKKIAGYLTLE